VTLLTEQKLIGQQIVRLYNFMHAEHNVREAEQPVRIEHVQGELRLNRVAFRYDSRPDHPVLTDLTLQIRSGEKLAIAGSSGSGKSTLLKLLGRLYDPNEGTVLLDGVPLRNLSFEQLRHAVGYVFQETFLFPGTVADNIRFGRLDATEEELSKAARAAYATEFIERLPDGFDTQIGERGMKLSGGQKQRIAIARLFLKNPTVLLLDEATSALDNVSEREVQKALMNLMEGRTTITVAHRLSTVMHADRIVVIKDGTVAEEGTYSELIAMQGMFARLVHEGVLADPSETERNEAS